MKLHFIRFTLFLQMRMLKKTRHVLMIPVLSSPEVSPPSLTPGLNPAMEGIPGIFLGFNSILFFLANSKTYNQNV